MKEKYLPVGIFTTRFFSGGSGILFAQKPNGELS